MQGIEEHAAKLAGRPPKRRAQIGSPHVADEQSIPGKYGVRLAIAGVQIVDHDGDRFRSVARSFEYFQPDASEFQNVAITNRRELIRRFRRRA